MVINNHLLKEKNNMKKIIENAHKQALHGMDRAHILMRKFEREQSDRWYIANTTFRRHLNIARYICKRRTR